MECYIQTTANGRIVARMPLDTPYSTNGFFIFDLPENLEHPLNDYVIENGALVFDEAEGHIREREENRIANERAEWIAGAPEQIGTDEDGLIEVAELSSTNEASIEDLTDAIMELAAMIGGGSNNG